ncbi:MAG: COX15/CtaA family protein [Planctomycetes bacterium]|nr:COX15/CtaA family protein [Planctomycetota bacterium]
MQVTTSTQGAARVPPLLTKVLAIGTLLVIVAGSIVTSTESGMADEHWPSFDGQLVPSWQAMRDDRGKLFEHGHRIMAGSIVVFTWAVAVFLACRETRLWVRRMAWGAAVVGLLPALLGGLTVLYETPPELSVVHVSLAMLFLSLNTATAVVTGSRWASPTVESEPVPVSNEDGRWVRRMAVVVASSVYLQIILGAVVRHAYVGVMIHILWAFVVFTLVFLLVARVFSRFSKLPQLLRPGVVLVVTVLFQFFLGLTAYVTRPKGVNDAGSDLHQVVATTHQFVGALMLVACIILLLHAFRLKRFDVVSAAAVAGGAP